MIWRKIQAEDSDWEVRVFSVEPDRDHFREEILEFRPVESTLPPRRVAIGRADVETMAEEQIKSAFRQARPLAGDYGDMGTRWG